MGNTLASARGGKKKKKAKLVKLDGEIIKLETPIKVFEVIKDYAGHVLLESGSVKQYGIRASPLDPEEYLEGGKVYFLVELPKLPHTMDKKAVDKKTVTRRVKSGVNLNTKERLELMMLSRRALSDVSLDDCGPVRVKVRLPKAEVDKVIGECKNDVEVAERIVDLYAKKKARDDGWRLGRKEMTVG
ncbi:hypothetical protein CTI12_AA030850 [Artemisia annua]|uniref:Uncharacterized protein n=1 Tax=Artemisia annua TaxID=35608 RepID=A0A2U1QH09_ARTAN|nr:hypothetical protein CTI12_AA030850 [Artemisia annua]